MKKLLFIFVILILLKAFQEQEQIHIGWSGFKERFLVDGPVTIGNCTFSADTICFGGNIVGTGDDELCLICN